MSILMFNAKQDNHIKGVPSFIQIVQEDGVWGSTWQVRCHYPSPTGDMSDWCSFDIGCATESQAEFIAIKYGEAFGIEVNS